MDTCYDGAISPNLDLESACEPGSGVLTFFRLLRRSSISESSCLSLSLFVFGTRATQPAALYLTTAHHLLSFLRLTSQQGRDDTARNANVRLLLTTTITTTTIRGRREAGREFGRRLSLSHTLFPFSTDYFIAPHIRLLTSTLSELYLFLRAFLSFRCPFFLLLLVLCLCDRRFFLCVCRI